MYDTILVPTDGSDGANRAVEHALDLAEHYQATVHALFVVDTSRYGEPALSSTELVIDELEAEGKDLLDELADRADNKGLEVIERCCHGIPHDEITGYAEQIDADLIVLGFQGHSHHNMIGSVAERVTRSGARPVLIV
jgi:nucleotide-binding universal stress UspA family protein